MHPAGDVSPEIIARDVLDSLHEGCQVIGFDWTYLYVNDAVVAQSQRPREALLGRTMMECFPGIDETPMFPVLERCMKLRNHERMENEFRFPDGSLGWFELRFVPVPEGACILSLDITESKRTIAALSRSEEQVRQMQKMEAVGRLAGGVAHDFNNLLTAIMGYGQFLALRFGAEDPAGQDVQEILRAADRAASLTRQLLAFSRQQVLDPRVLELNTIVHDLERMLGRLIGEDVDLVFYPAEDLGRVKADPGQIEQALVNLVVNARDAMPDGGKLTIETGNVQLDPAYAESRVEIAPGPYVMLAVSDTGCGMSRETVSKIFEPFFTTKPKGQGTGLGLSTVHGIVKQSGGHVEVYSEPGHGTTFKIYLPRVEAAAEIWPVTTPEAPRRGGRETLLLVEDEEVIRRVMSEALRQYGYTVRVAADPAEAIALCEADGRIDLLVTDVVMPLMSGPDLVRRIAALRPELPTLFVSGYTDRALIHQGLRQEGSAFLQKPFTPDTLVAKVREVLDGVTPGRDGTRRG